MEKPLFVDDIHVKNAYTGILLRSPVVSGTLKEIRTPKLPYNVSFVTAADIPGPALCRIGRTGDTKSGEPNRPGYFEIPIFPDKELSWYGQPAAMLLGPDPVKLRAVAEKCTVLAEANLAEAAEGEKAGLEKTVILERNYKTSAFEKVDVTAASDMTAAFEKAARVVEGSYHAGLQDPWPTDPLGVIALPGPGQAMTIHTSTQWPGHVRSAVARCLDIKPAMVEVEVSRLEIHLDGKVWPPSLLACQAAVGARKTGKPVKLVLQRGEDFLFSPKSVGAEIRIQSALDAQGAILGTRLTINADFGAFGIFAEEILDRIALGALGAYSHGSISLEARGFRSPIPPAGPTAGFGLVQGFFAAERHASRIADILEEDPAEWRKNFFLRKGRKLPIGTEIRNPPMEELIDSAEAMSDYRRKWASYELLRKNRRVNPSSERRFYDPIWGPRRGIGISLAYQGASFLYDYREPKAPEEGVELTLEKDGTLEIRTSLPWGDNQIHSWRTLAGKILGVETIRVVSKNPPQGPAAFIPESGPACLSRSIALITPLIERACMAIRKQRFRDPLPITVHRYHHAAKIRPWEERPGASSASFIDENALGSLSWGAAVVEAEIDPALYAPKIRGMWLALEGGTILSEERAKKSIGAASLQALSWAMQEKVRYRDGRIDETRVKDYPVRVEESPPVVVDFLWSEGAPRGIGELPFATIPAAYVQALTQALDYPFRHYPVDSGDIWAAVQSLRLAVEKRDAERGAV